MKVLVVGGGGREHTLVWKLSQSPKVDKIYCAPGNAGIGDMAELVNIKAEDIEGLLNFALEKDIDLTVVGPEVPLVNGIVDKFQEEGLKVFGPNKACAQLEGSKAFAKDFMMRHNIPTAKYREYTNVDEAINDIGVYGYPMVIKADGLAAGKGVIIAQDEKEAYEALNMIMKDKKFGDAGSKVVIEEFLDGIEASILCFVDGETIVPMVSAQDYKKAFDGDKGPNTGGMGTYSPSIVYNDDIKERVKNTILMPFINGLKADGLDYRGIVFIGLMIKDGQPNVLEFNTRFGDPETQVVLSRLKTDLVEIIESILEGKLKDQVIEWSSKKAVCVILASEGYPGTYEKGKAIDGLENVKNVVVFHAGTKLVDGKVVANGGRVLGVVATGDTINEAREIVYKNIDKINFEGKQYRRDIGEIALG
ncbi:phosphoribosylamine--glycine ligase [Paramaledivibacter caminithermalis]|jgi:phosphoribosylamine--glycine ligase|uniref:Phosphoribosylamine--glycine ligase n=1 Tax=Paramaledivibacter caminithermalis (strain DSM 15212 / CIP 107654 / DViRD3) TaxID=1121301 RepID=A0A1M6QIS7_PARC5|nr:phosphoribosylamine--glycine ligase [Paramaledivibacter caminithermalis]SHK20214.1 phosphoribosylamine--glycine ligase [Paramaledivibacter caminithermalis DSM 15212]